MGSAGDSPAPVGDPPTGTAEAYLVKRPASLARTATPVPSSGSPDGTGGSPVLPGEDFSNRHSCFLSSKSIIGHRSLEDDAPCVQLSHMSGAGREIVGVMRDYHEAGAVAGN